MNVQELRVCKKCLIRDIGDEELAVAVREYVGSVDKKLRTEDEEYEKRLRLCTGCEKLVRGTCTVCGCYVEMRAAVSANSCPLVHPLW